MGVGVKKPSRPLSDRQRDVLCRLCATGQFMRLNEADENAAEGLEDRGLAERAWFSRRVWKSTDAGDDFLFRALVGVAA
jgi:hypothetical protein